MLGELIFEGEGRFVYYKILRNGKMEDTEEYKGNFLGEKSILTITAEGEIEPDGTGCFEFCGSWSTDGGSRTLLTGVGNITIDPNGPNSWRGAFCINKQTGKFAKLSGVAIVFEGEWDENFLRIKAWEWK